MDKDIRWKQRFQNFEKALKYLEDIMNIKKPDIAQKAGLIHFFEISFELSWNTIKDYVEDQGFTDIKSPRSAIKKGFEIGLIGDGHTGLELLEDRNITAHTYDEEKITEIENIIRKKYYPLLKQLHSELNKKNQ